MAVMYPRTSWQRERMIGNVPHRERTKIMRTPKLDDKCSWIQNVPLFVGISPQVCRIPSWWHSQSKGARGPWKILMIRWVDSPWHCQWWNWWHRHGRSSGFLNWGESFWKGPACRSQTPTTNLWQCNSSQLTMSKMNLFKGLGECILLIHYEIRNLMGAKWKTSESPWHCCKKELVLLN